MPAKKDQPKIWRKSTEVQVGDVIRMWTVLKPAEFLPVARIVDHGRVISFYADANEEFQYTATKNEYVLGRY